jgi:hypothetical protein
VLWCRNVHLRYTFIECDAYAKTRYLQVHSTCTQSSPTNACLHVTSLFLYMSQMLGQKRENRITCTNVFQLFLSTSVQQRLHVVAVGCRILFSGLLGMLIFDILQIPNGCSHISSGYNAHTCTPLATDLITGVGCKLKVSHRRHF